MLKQKHSPENRNISKLTLGTVQLGMPYGIHNRSGMPSKEKSFELLQQAWEGGVVSYDTAAAYGQSETILGSFFQNKHPPLITTKIHLHPEPGASRRDIEQDMREKIKSSLNRLQMTTVPILMLHNTDAMDRFGDSITASFLALKRDGVIGKAGISVSFNTPEEYRRLRPYLQDETYEAIQIPMNVLDHRPLNNGCLGKLKQAGKDVFVRSIFLQGLIYMKEEELPPKLQIAKEPLSKLRQLSVKYDIPLAQMAVSFIRDLAGVSSLVIGAETVEQVRENLALIEGMPIPQDLREEIVQTFREVPEIVITPSLWK